MNTLPDDITARRHKNNAHSVEANRAAEPTKAVMRDQIVRWARFFGPFTMRDVCRAFDKYPNEISGRLSELKALKLIEETGNTRERCAVLRLIERGQQIKLF